MSDCDCMCGPCAAEVGRLTAENERLRAVKGGENLDALLMEGRDALFARVAEVRRLRDELAARAEVSARTHERTTAQLDTYRRRIGLLTGRMLDAGVLLANAAREHEPSEEFDQLLTDFVALITKDIEGATIDGPCEVPLLYCRADIGNTLDVHLSRGMQRTLALQGFCLEPETKARTRT